MGLHLRSKGVAVVMAAAFSLSGVACSSSSSNGSPGGLATPTGPTLPPPDPAQALPPNDVATIRRLYDPILEPMGLRVSRATLVNVDNDGYVPSDNGTHLALYAKPLSQDRTDAQYVDGLWQVSALITPDVFSRWSGIDSYDLCQEPTSDTDSSAEPFPVTMLSLRRASSDSIDWEHGSLTDLLYASRTQGGFQLLTSKSIRQTDEFRIADQEARDRVGADKPSTGPTDPDSAPPTS